VWQKIAQAGPAVLENGVEVQANSCIDRASVGETRIGSGVKIDNLVQVGHGSKVDANSLLCAQVGLAGSSEIGRNAILAGQVGVAGHCKVGDGVIMTAQSGVSHDVPAGKVISGSPAFDNRQWLKATAIFNRLPDIIRQLQRRDKAEKVLE
jgi:UDP-3-O-[3-hydroxymyristoyl] glucosamine N-acyltransferase